MVLRSDNVKEYFFSGFPTYLNSHGYLHQSTFSHTPQQNGIVERKIRHLIETVRTLLPGANVFVQGDAILFACYFINRMSFSSLNNKVPFSIVFPNDILFQIPPPSL